MYLSASFEYLCYGYAVYSFSVHRDRLYTSESDVYRRHIMTYKDGPRAERVKYWTTVPLNEWKLLTIFLISDQIFAILADTNCTLNG